MKPIPPENIPILMIGYTYYDSDPRVIREAEAAAGAGFAVDFLALRRPGCAKKRVVRGVTVISVAQAKYRGNSYLMYALEYLKFFFRCFACASLLSMRRRYALVHVNNMPDVMVFAALIPKALGAKIILDIHDPMPNTFASKFGGDESGFFFRVLLWLERLSAMFSDIVTTVHHPVKRNILMKHGFSDEDIEVVANFPDLSMFPVSKPSTPPGELRFVFHGTILKRAGLSIVLEALAMVRHRDRISLLIIGEGDYSEGIRQRIAALGLADVVEFDNNTYPADMIAARMQGCNVGLVPLELSSATRHALPLKLLEYIAMGLPVVSVRNDAISYYLSETDCLFFRWDSPSSLAAVIDELADRPELLETYRERSLALRSRLSWNVEKENYLALIRRLLGVPERHYAAATRAQ